jgi:hypothetical protein
MSNKEYCLSLLESFSDAQLTVLTEYMERLKRAEEDEDMAYCVELYDTAKREKNPEYVPFDAALAEIGLTVDDLRH